MAVGKHAKAEFALDLLWQLDTGVRLAIPNYIQEGLEWLESQVRALPLIGTIVEIDEPQGHVEA